MKDVNKLSPLTKFCHMIGAIPTSYLVAMSYDEQLMWLCDYLKNTVIPAINENGEAVEELQNLYIALKKYVDDYFDNLDIQSEVDAKLEEMVESGELQEIIGAYLQSSAVLGFANKAGMKAGTSFIVGSICRILGKTNYATGDGSYYRIRTLTSGDTIDDENIVALTNFPTLIAEKIPHYYINDLQTQINNIDTHDYRNAIYIGNSFTVGRGSSDDETGLFALTKDKLYDNAYMFYGSGTGFTAYDSQHQTTFVTLLQNAIASSDFDNDTITDINFVCAWGEANGDAALGSDYVTQAYTNMLSIKSLIAQNFPNIKRVNVINCETRAYLNYSGDRYYYRLWRIHNYLRILCDRLSFSYCNWIGFEIILRPDWFADDTVHPNDEGYRRLSGFFIDAINGQFQNSIKQHTGVMNLDNIEGMKAKVTVTVGVDHSSVVFQSIDQSSVVSDPTYTANTFSSFTTSFSSVIPPVKCDTTDNTDSTKKRNNVAFPFKLMYGNFSSTSVLNIIGTAYFYTSGEGSSSDCGIKFAIPTNQMPATKPTTSNITILYPNCMPTTPEAFE